MNTCITIIATIILHCECCFLLPTLGGVLDGFILQPKNVRPTAHSRPGPKPLEARAENLMVLRFRLSQVLRLWVGGLSRRLLSRLGRHGPVRMHA